MTGPTVRCAGPAGSLPAYQSAGAAELTSTPTSMPTS